MDLAGAVISQLIDPAEEDELMARLGPDPLRRHARADRMRTALARRKGPIGAALLDQSVIAGLGNVYRAEILFACGIDPLREARSLTDDEVDADLEDGEEDAGRGREVGQDRDRSPQRGGQAAVEADRQGPPPGLQARALPPLRHAGADADRGGADAVLVPGCQPAAAEAADLGPERSGRWARIGHGGTESGPRGDARTRTGSVPLEAMV